MRRACAPRRRRRTSPCEALYELNLGATAVGTGLNAGDDYTRLAIDALARLTTLPLVPAANRFRVTQSMGDVVTYSGALRRLAVELSKIASDLRLLSMGPRAGIAEIRCRPCSPARRSCRARSIHPCPEMVNQVCYQVFGCDTTVMMAGEAGQLELNVMMPVIAWNALHAQRILTTRCARCASAPSTGIEADRERARELLDRSTAVATALSPLHRLRSHRGNREGGGRQRPLDSRPRARARLAARRAARSHSQRRGDDRPASSAPDAAQSRRSTARRPRAPVDRRGPGESAMSARRGDRRIARRPDAVAARRQPDTRAVARAAVPAGGPRAARSARSRYLAAARSDHGRAGDRRSVGRRRCRRRQRLVHVRLARRVGPNGIVYAEDVQQEMLTAISRRVAAEGLPNVKPVRGQPQRSAPAAPQPARRADGRCVSRDRGSRDVAAESRQSLRPDGRLGVVDFKLEGGGPGPADGGARQPGDGDQRRGKCGAAPALAGDVPPVSVLPDLRLQKPQK